MTNATNTTAATYTVKFCRQGRGYLSETLYTGPSRGEAGRAAAKALGYSRISSAYTYTAPTREGDDAVFYCRKADASKEDFDVVYIVAR